MGIDTKAQWHKWIRSSLAYLGIVCSTLWLILQVESFYAVFLHWGGVYHSSSVTLPPPSVDTTWAEVLITIAPVAPVFQVVCMFSAFMFISVYCWNRRK